MFLKLNLHCLKLKLLFYENPRLLNFILASLPIIFMDGNLAEYNDELAITSEDEAITSEDEAEGTNEGEEAKMDAFLDEMLAESAFEKEIAAHDEVLRNEYEAGASDLSYKDASAKKSDASNALFDRYKSNQHSLLFDLHYPMDSPSLDEIKEEELKPAPDYEFK